MVTSLMVVVNYFEYLNRGFNGWIQMKAIKTAQRFIRIFRLAIGCNDRPPVPKTRTKLCYNVGTGSRTRGRDSVNLMSFFNTTATIKRRCLF